MKKPNYSKFTPDAIHLHSQNFATTLKQSVAVEVQPDAVILNDVEFNRPQNILELTTFLREVLNVPNNVPIRNTVSNLQM